MYQDVSACSSALRQAAPIFGVSSEIFCTVVSSTRIEGTFRSVAMTTPFVALMPSDVAPAFTAFSAYSICTSLPLGLKVVSEKEYCERHFECQPGACKPQNTSWQQKQQEASAPVTRPLRLTTQRSRCAQWCAPGTTPSQQNGPKGVRVVFRPITRYQVVTECCIFQVGSAVVLNMQATALHHAQRHTGSLHIHNCSGCIRALGSSLERAESKHKPQHRRMHQALSIPSYQLCLEEIHTALSQHSAMVHTACEQASCAPCHAVASQV